MPALALASFDLGQPVKLFSFRYHNKEIILTDFKECWEDSIRTNTYCMIRVL